MGFHIVILIIPVKFCVMGFLFIVLAIFALLSSIGLGIMYEGEKTINYKMYTTLNETFQVYKNEELTLMKEVCIKDPDKNFLFTIDNDCKHRLLPEKRPPYTLNITLTSTDATGLFFYFVKGSSITTNITTEYGTIWYSSSKDGKDEQKLKDSCNKNLKEIFDDFEQGYYYICIHPKKIPLILQITVMEEYYYILKKYQIPCEDTENRDGSEYKCCNFPRKDRYTFHCVYLSTTNTEPMAVYRPSVVQLSIQYDTATKGVQMVVIAIFIFYSIGLLVMYMYSKYKGKCGQPVAVECVPLLAN